jgi:hypothetical protein
VLREYIKVSKKYPEGDGYSEAWEVAEKRGFNFNARSRKARASKQACS